MAKAQQQPEVRPDEGGVALYFSYNLFLSIRPDVVSMAGAQYKTVPAPHWFIPMIAGNAAKVRTLAAKHGFTLLDGVELAFNSEPKVPERKVILQDDDLALIFEKGDPIMEQVQRLPKRKFNYAPFAHWTVPAVIENAELLIKIVDQGFHLDEAAASVVAKLRCEWLAQPKTLNVRYDEDLNLLVVDLPYRSPLEAEVIRLVGAKKARGKLGRYTMPVTPKTFAALVDMTQRSGTTIEGATLENLKKAVEAYQENVRNSAAAHGIMEFENVNGEPRPFQRAGVAYALEHERLIIGDQQGLGKTVQGILFFHGAKSLPVVIFAPPNLILNWKEELNKWVPQYTVSVLKGNKPKLGDYDADVILCAYSIVNNRVENGMIDEMEKRGCKAFICDESHYLKNHEKNKSREYKTQRVRGVKKFSEGKRYRLLLTGTPITSKPIEFASQLDIIGVLDPVFGGFSRFSREFGGAHMGAFGVSYGTVSPAKLHDMNEILRSCCYIRRTKDQVLSELPAKQRSVVYFELANRSEYLQAQNDVVEYLVKQIEQDEAFQQTIAVYDEETQKILIKERQKDKAYSARQAEALVKINTLKQLAVKGKIAAITEWLQTFAESGEKIIVFAHHRWVQQELIQAFPNAARLIADDINEVKQLNKNRFQTDENCTMIICSDVVGAEGHTLTAASNVAFVELGWTPTQHEQCEDRAHRIGQKDSVTAWYLLAHGSIDIDIYNLIESKRQQVEAATNGTIGTNTETSMLKDVLKNLTTKATQ